MTVRYLVARSLKSRTLYYWLPTPKLRRAGFATKRLPDDYGLAVAAAEAENARLDAWYRGEKAAPALGGLWAVDDAFQRDDAFRKLRDRTQRDYLYNVKAALEWVDGVPVSAISRKALKEWYRCQRDDRGPAAARNAMAALRRLLTFAADEGVIPRNPALKLGMASPGRRTGVWSLADLDAFTGAAMAAGRPSMALAALLGWCLGQRPADLRSLAWSAYDGQGVSIRQAKTEARIWVPALPELRRLLDATERTSPVMVVSEVTRRPYAESDFQHTFARIRDGAGLPASLQFRDLRRTLATALGAAGCTDDQIRAVTGHKTREVVGVYVLPDRTFAQGAMDRLEGARGGKKSAG